MIDQVPALPPTSGDKPWLHWYEPGVPDTIEVLNLPLPHFLAVNAERYPDRPAIHFFGRMLSYR